MPTLHWIGKDKVVNHHQDVPYKVLEHQYGYTEKGQQEESTNSGNKIIHGDNLEALKSLLPEYEGRIKCIYIDPPYNTGQEKWVYNDNVNHPAIKKWLGEVVGKEGDDFTRHDKWLCMMYPRIKLLHKLLANDGVIFVSIDDYEYHNLVALMNQIFGYKNKIATSIWDLGSGTQAGHFTRAHEYILIYSKNKSLLPNFSGGEGIIDDRAIKKIGVKNPASDFTFPKGTKWEVEDGFQLEGSWGGSEKTELVKGKMIAKDGKLTEAITLRAGWTQKNQMESFFSGETTFDTKGQKIIEFYFRKNGKIYSRKERSIINPPTVIRELASTKTGTTEAKNILGSDKFNFPKPSVLIEYLLGLVTTDEDIILDSFAGTGTTGQAVLKLNRDGNKRKFILIELEDYANEITAERVKKTINGYGEEDKAVEGIPGSFDFYELGEPIFNEDQNLNEEVGEAHIRNYIYYSETKQPLKREQEANAKYLLDNYQDTGYYFYYEKDSLTTLDLDTLHIVAEKQEQYIIYADICLLDPEYMLKKNIIFKKIPRDIKRF